MTRAFQVPQNDMVEGKGSKRDASLAFLYTNNERVAGSQPRAPNPGGDDTLTVTSEKESSKHCFRRPPKLNRHETNQK